MSSKKNRRAGNGWVRDRKKFGAGPPVKYPFSAEKSPQDSETGNGMEAGEVLQEEEPKDIPEDGTGTESGDTEQAGTGEESGDIPDIPEGGCGTEPGNTEQAGTGEEAGDIPDIPEDGTGTQSGGSEETGSREEPDEIQMPDPEDEDILQSAFPDRQDFEEDLIQAQDSEKVPVVTEEAAGQADEDSRLKKYMTRERVDKIHLVLRTAIAGFFAFLFLMPIVLTITNSFMTSSEINANYGMIFAKSNGVRVFISKTVNLKFIPDIISFDQYFKALFLSPEYLMKFWNSFFYVVPIVIFQLAVASLASYGFARYRGRVREVIFFSYIILMLMPYQVTLVPNYLVSTWLNIIDTRWAILLPGFFSPFAVYMLTKYMRRIPSSIYEAAEIDGAGEWQIFTGVCLPNCRGGLVSIAILIFIDYWNMVEQPLILLSDDQLHPLSVFLSRINAEEISLAFAVAVIYMVLPMMVFLYGEDYLVEGIIYQGGIKE